MENEFRFLEFEGVQVAAFIETRNQNEHINYFPSNILYCVQQGQLNLRLKDKLYTIGKGNFCLVKKFTEVSCSKTWSEDEDCAMVDALVLQDDFIKDAIKELNYKVALIEQHEPVVDLGRNAILVGLYQSLNQYLYGKQSPDKHLMFLKTKEALLGIVQSNPDHLSLFYEVSKTVKADLKVFMHHHCYANLTLKELARLSGRSLSTFNRDFRKVFDTTPHSWLLKKRLHRAKELLQSTNGKPSAIYLELGFKDLAHFSRSFKKECRSRQNLERSHCH
ncbi:MAG: AraC family transcriptional regulator [Bacteroidota bacterium]